MRTTCLAAPVPVALLAVAAARWLTRRVCWRCGAIDRRAWAYCHRCGLPRGGGDEAGATPPGTRTATIPPVTTDEPIHILPSELLRRGWCREPALNDRGCEVDPGAETAVAWSVWGACDRAFEAHSRLWRAYRKGLDGVMAERYGGVSARVWNRHRARRKRSVVEVAQEVERRIGIARSSNS